MPTSALGTESGTPQNAALSKYQTAVRNKVVETWTPPSTFEPVTIRLSWKLKKNGSVFDVKILNTGITGAGQNAAIDAVQKSAPFPPLPPGTGDEITMKCVLHKGGSWRSVKHALQDFGAEFQKIMRQKCESEGIAYPPKKVTIIGLKEERRLLLFAGDRKMKLIGTYPLVSYCGVLGPKLKEGDLQIPEGIYRITGLQAGNLLAFTLNYPNSVDRKNAALDHRTKLGRDILVHGGSLSTGCFVISNDDMKRLFIVVNDVGYRDASLIIAPCDLTRKASGSQLKHPLPWLPALYASLKTELAKYPLPAQY